MSDIMVALWAAVLRGGSVTVIAPDERQAQAVYDAAVATMRAS